MAIPLSSKGRAVRDSDAGFQSPTCVRLVITNRCTLKCFFCFNEGFPHHPVRPVLEVADYLRVVSGLVQRFGMSKIRVTGGEPLASPVHLPLLLALRKQFPNLNIGLTTNGTLLPQLTRILSEPELAGLGLNVSLPTLQRRKFAELTGSDAIDDTLEGVKLAARINPTHTKINCVYLQHAGNEDVREVVEFARGLGLPVKLLCLNTNPHNKVELTRANELPYSVDVLIEFLEATGYVLVDRSMHAARMVSRNHVVEAVQCCDSDPILYYQRFRTLRVFFDGTVAVTGSFDGFSRPLDVAQPIPAIEDLLQDMRLRKSVRRADLLVEVGTDG